MSQVITIIGGGLAGSEAAFQAAELGLAEDPAGVEAAFR